MTTKTAFQRWYALHKDTFNSKRRKAYKTNSLLREKSLTRQKNYRKNHPGYRVARVATRLVCGVHTRVFRIGVVAQMIGRGEQVIRIWERKGIIPKPTIAGVHRYYTLKQVELLKELADAINAVRYKRVLMKSTILEKSAEIYSQWEENHGN